MPHAPNTLSLIADIGGTNTRVALADGTRLVEGSIARFRNAEHSGLGPVLASYLEDHDNPDCKGACVALAGPVRDGIGKMTNLDWTIDRETIAHATKAEHAVVINDLQAQGYAMGHLPETAVRCLKPGAKPWPAASLLMVGIGTGFNIAPVHFGPVDHLVVPAEAGHMMLPTRRQEDRALADFLETEFAFPSVEEALSGRGIAQVAAFHSERNGNARRWTSDQVIDGARSGDETALATVQHAVRLLGGLAGDLALGHLPMGGLFLVGGLSRALAPWIEGPDFAEAMHDKGRFGDLATSVPVWLVEDDYAALIGGAVHLANRLS